MGDSGHRLKCVWGLAVLVAAVGSTTGSALAGQIPVNRSVVNGEVRSMAMDGAGRLYLGGIFSRMGPNLGHGLLLTAPSDQPVPGFPFVDDWIEAIVPDGSGGWFIGGDFTSVGGRPRNGLAHILADHTVDPAWNPDAQAPVTAMALSGTSLFVGGYFNRVGGQPHIRLAKVSTLGTGAVDADWQAGLDRVAATLAISGTDLYVGAQGKLVRFATTGAGTLDALWTLNPTGTVSALAVSGSSLFAGGDFFSIGGQSRSGLAKLATTGAGDADPTWDPSPGSVSALLVDGSGLYVGGQFVAIGGQNRSNLARVALTGAGAADATWNPDVEGAYVRTLTLSGSSLLVGGLFDRLGGVSGADRSNLGRVATTGSGAVDASWDPSPDDEVFAVGQAGNDVLAGGAFRSAGTADVARRSLGRLNADGTVDTGWNPAPLMMFGLVSALELVGDELVIGGDFALKGVGGGFNLAKLSTASPAAVIPSWKPNPTSPVTALTISGSDLFVGGMFTGVKSISNVDRDYLAKLDLGTGDADLAWDAGFSGVVTDPFQPISALAVSGSSLFVSGAFSGDFGAATTREYLAKLGTGAATADPTWDPQINAPARTIALSGSDLIVGGEFSSVGAVPRRRLAKVSTTGAGAADPVWDPNPTGSRISALLPTGPDLFIGGTFTAVGAAARAGIARVSASGPGAVSPTFSPRYPGGALALVTTGSRLFVGGTAGLAIYDLTDPVVVISIPAEGARYGQNRSVAAAYTCPDPDGAADTVTCTGSVAAGSPIDTTTPGGHSFTVTATDAGGNTDSRTVSYVVDGTAPRISVTAPEAGAVYASGAVVTAAYDCTDPDGPADVVSCSGPVGSGAPIDTTAGRHNFVVTTADAAGNTDSQTVIYDVTAAPATAPVLSALTVRPGTFRAAHSGKAVVAARRRIGARIRYRLSTPASVRFTVRRKAGKRRPKVGAFRASGVAGANALTFRGRLRGTSLRAGRYVIAAVATGPSGLRSATVTTTFRIVR